MLQLQMLAAGMQEFHKLVNPKTKLISLVHVSNTLGTILPTQEVVEAAQKVKHICLLLHVSKALQWLSCLSVCKYGDCRGGPCPSMPLLTAYRELFGLCVYVCIHAYSIQ